jgi:hypothetical protein
MDGTFYTYPKNFYQLFIIYYVQNYKYKPFAYFLLPNKPQVAYEKMFDFVVLKNVGIKNISNIIVDFEAAIENGLMNKFANVVIRYCVFHYSQAVYRKLKSLGLETKYRKNTEFRLHIKCILCFSFIPENYRKPVFKSLAKEFLSLFSEIKERDFINYYYQNWYQGNYFRNDDLYLYEDCFRYSTYK